MRIRRSFGSTGTAVAVLLVGALFIMLLRGAGEAPLPVDSPISAPEFGTPPFSDALLGSKWNWQQAETLRPWLVSSRGGITFLEIDWCEVEAQPGSWDWSRSDRILQRSGDLAFRMMLKLRVGSCWASAQNLQSSRSHKKPSSPPRDLQAYRQFIVRTVERYSPKGVRSWSIENEINASNSWVGPFDDYQAMMRVASAAIHQVDSNARVVDSGIASPVYGVIIAEQLLREGKGREALEFYRGYLSRLQAGGRSPYPWPTTVEDLRSALLAVGPQRGLSAAETTFALVEEGLVDAYQLHFYEPVVYLHRVLEYLKGRLPAHIPVEAWEIGVAWPGDDYDEADHASETAKLLATLLGAGIGQIVYLPVAWTPGSWLGSEVWRGLALPDGTARPASEVYSLFNALIDGAEWTAIDNTTAKGLTFERDGIATMVVWSDNGGRLDGAAPAGADVRTLNGDEVRWTGVGLQLDDEPLVITGSPALVEAVQ